MRKNTLNAQALKLWIKLFKALNTSFSYAPVSTRENGGIRERDALFAVTVSPEYNDLVDVDLNYFCQFDFYGNDKASVAVAVVKNENCVEYNKKVNEIGGGQTVTWKEAYCMVKELVNAIENDMLVFPPQVEEEIE